MVFNKMIKRNPFQKQTAEPKRLDANLTKTANAVRKMGMIKPRSLIRRQNEEDERNVEQPEQEG